MTGAPSTKQRGQLVMAVIIHESLNGLLVLALYSIQPFIKCALIDIRVMRHRAS